VRVDSGVEQGTVIGQAFDSLLAKLIVTGRDRRHALERARRALAEFEVDGMVTVLPFHRAVVVDPAFAPTEGHFSVHTRWIETEFDNTIPPFEAVPDYTTPPNKQTMVVEVDGRRIEAVVPAGFGAMAAASPAPAPRRSAAKKQDAAASADALATPMQGTIVKIAVKNGQRVSQGDLIVVLEAMKMEQPLTAHKAGLVEDLVVEVGATVPRGAVLCTLRD
jgi:acetyl-CoA/propionyl-CoA carboxylase biotin carboxyl carrier protein